MAATLSASSIPAPWWRSAAFAYFPNPSGLFLSPDERRAYAVHAASATISVVDLLQQRLLATSPLRQAPLDGVVSADGRLLFLINDYSEVLSVLHASTLQTQSEVYIGSGALTIGGDHSTNLLYIGRRNGEIAVVDPRARMAIDTFFLPAPVVDLAIDNEENALFAVLPSISRLLKIDLVSKRELGRLELEAGSQAVVVMGQRF